MSWAEVGALRRAMSKSKGLEDHREIFLRGSAHPKQFMQSVWTNLVTFGSYGFNRSHSVAYGVVSYWCGWLKANYPLEFACATLIHEPDAEKQFKTLRELAKEGIGYTPVDVKLSAETWTIDRKNKKLVGPLTNIVGMGPKTVAAVMSSRVRKEKLPDRAAKLLAKATTTIDTLSPVARWVEGFDLKAARVVAQTNLIEEILPPEISGDHMVIAVVEKITPIDENDPKRVERRKGKKLADGANHSVNLWLRDDTGKIFAKIPPEVFDKKVKSDLGDSNGQDVIARGKADKAIYAILGGLRAGEFRMLSVKRMRYLGEL
jgi:hypothetical protein